MGDNKLPSAMASRERERELLIPVAEESDSRAPPSASVSASAHQLHQSGREACYKVVRSWASKKFMTGCVILFPIAITFYITWWFIHFVDGFFSPIYAQLGIDIFAMIMDAAGSTLHYNLKLRHPTLDVPNIDYQLALLIQSMLMLGISIRVAINVAFVDWMVVVFVIILFLRLGFMTSITFIFLVGVFMSSWLGASVLGLGEWFIKQMPLVRHIYNASKQISAAISPDQNTQAFKEVAIIRHPRHGEYAFGFITSTVVLQAYSGEEELCCVYVPTNHLYIGDIFLINSKDVIRPNLSVREGIEIVVSVGMSMPQALSVLDSQTIQVDRTRTS